MAPKCQATDGDSGSSSEEPAPNRNTHGYATRFASHLRSFRRSGSSTSPSMATRNDRRVETLSRKRVDHALRDAVKRHAATFDPTRPSVLCPRGNARKRSTLGRARPTAGRSPLRRPARSSLSRAARRCRHLRAVRVPNRLPTHSSLETTTDPGDPKAALVDAIPCVELTPDDHLTVIPRHPSCRALRKCEHPTESAACG